MLFNIFITLYLLARDRRSPMMQGLYGIALVLEFIALFYSQTRGALLGVIGGLLVMGIWIAWRATEPQWRTVRLWSFGLLAGLVVLAGAFFAVKDTSFVRNSSTLNRIASISFADKTTQARFTIWRDMAIPGALEKPVFGWGQENFNFVFNKYYVPSMYDQEQWFDRTHNEFLDWLISGGFPALILYALFFIAAIWAIYRSQLSAPEQAAFLGLLAAYGFSNLTVFHDLMSFAFFFLILAFLHGQSSNAIPRFMSMFKPADDKMVSIAAPIIAAIVLIGGWMLNGPAVSRAQTLLSAVAGTDLSTHKQLSPEQQMAQFKLALAGNDIGRQESMEQLFQFTSNSIAPSNAINPQTKQDAFNFTKTSGEALLKDRPKDARLELFMSVFLAQFGQYDDSLAHLKKAEEYSPQKQQILFQVGQTYLQKGDMPNAVATFKKAFDLEPKYESARILYAGSLYYAGRAAEGDAVLKEGFGTVAYDNDQLLQVYSNTRQFARIVEIWKARVEKAPKDAQMVLGLAVAYFQASDVPNTIATLKKVAELDPSKAGDVNNTITQIQNGTLKPGAQ
jgi:tetratricopeptide (TPR) repeat protein